MEALIRKYIEESGSLIKKQAEEILSLKESAQEATASALVKKASEDTLDKITYMLGNGHYTPESVVDALRDRNTENLVKQATAEPVDDSWGELDGNSVDLNNIRPSDRKLYSRYGLI